jgi:hypothetical protein
MPSGQMLLKTASAHPLELNSKVSKNSFPAIVSGVSFASEMVSPQFNSFDSPMSDNPLMDTPKDTVPTCPHCGSALYPDGRIVAIGGIKKLVDPWCCPVHGQFPPEGNKPDS